VERGQITLPVRGRFDLRAALASGGDSVPPPWRWRDGARPRLERPERLPDGSVRLLTVRPEPGGVLVQVIGRHAREIETLAPLAVRMRRALWLDLAPLARRRLHRRTARLRPSGCGLRGTTVFEDVVGVLAAGSAGPARAHRGLAGLVSFGSRWPADRSRRAFPTPDVLARTSLRLLRQRTGLGQRAAWIRALARDVARGARQLQRLEDLPPADAARALRTIDGLGPAGVRAVLLLLGHAGGTTPAPTALRPSPMRAPRPRRAARS